MTPEPYPLTNASAKADWAKRHLDILIAEVEAFREDSHAIISQDEPELDRVRYRVELKQPHVYIFLILGDVLQCLRTALDQAVWSLIYHRTGEDRTTSEFPIFNVLSTANTTAFKRKTKGLPESAIAYIESIQPYHRTAGTNSTSHPLWQLHELNRIDKHRRISVRGQIAFSGRSYFGGTVPGADFAAVEHERTDYGFDVLCTGSYKHLKPQITSYVEFGEQQSGIVILVEGVTEIYNFITNEVLVGLAGFAR